MNCPRRRQCAPLSSLKAGNLVRLWRPPLGPGEWRSIGLFRAADEAELSDVLASLPLHIWMKVTIMPLTPYPNDPDYRTSQAMDHQQGGTRKTASDVGNELFLQQQT